jgi:hypothetical protein
MTSQFCDEEYCVSPGVGWMEGNLHFAWRRPLLFLVDFPVNTDGVLRAYCFQLCIVREIQGYE